MGRRRRKIIKRVVKPFPKLFTCPLCNELAVAVYHEEGSDRAKVMCGNCKTSVEVRWLPSYLPVDAYAEFYDIVTGARKPIEVSAQQLAETKTPSEQTEMGLSKPEGQGESHETFESREG